MNLTATNYQEIKSVRKDAVSLASEAVALLDHLHDQLDAACVDYTSLPVALIVALAQFERYVCCINATASLYA